MCFSQKQPQAVTPAGAPAPPDPSAAQQEIGGPRKTEDTSLYGSQTPDLRVRDTSVSSGGVGSAGSGLRM